jgi:hypothetical protein
LTETQEAAQTVAVPEGASITEQRAAAVTFFDPNMDFKKLAAAANYFTKGFRLVEDKDHLVGVPLVVTGITFREGYSTTEGPGDYASFEAVVADRDTLTSSPVKHYLPAQVDDLAIYPNEPIVFNDGGTGVRRSAVELLHDIGIIDVGPALGDENPYDKPYQLWAAGAERATTGIVADLNGEPFRWVAIRGLRRSDYDSPYGPATTFYFG